MIQGFYDDPSGLVAVYLVIHSPFFTLPGVVGGADKQMCGAVISPPCIFYRVFAEDCDTSDVDKNDLPLARAWIEREAARNETSLLPKAFDISVVGAIVTLPCF